MKSAKSKLITDIMSMLFTLTAIVTGFVLHKEVWHTHIYDDSVSWGIHETAGLSLIIFITLHCIQHSFWFKNYSKIHGTKKMVTTLLLILGIIIGITGVILMSGSRSEIISHIHYAGGILFTLVAIGHVVKRWKILKSLTKSMIIFK